MTDIAKGTPEIVTEQPAKFAMGKSMKRKEDPRFLQGKGNYIDDINLKDQLYMALVHSPYPHANIRGIDSSEAMKIPGAVAVVTSKELNAYNVGWLPTFHGLDKQMVLADGKVLYQYQEVAACYAETREAAYDMIELVEVDYEPLEVVNNPFKAMKDDVLLRPDDVVHDDASPVTAEVIAKAFRGAEFLYTLRLASGASVLSLVPSHHNHAIGERIGIRLEADHVVAYKREDAAMSKCG